MITVILVNLILIVFLLYLLKDVEFENGIFVMAAIVLISINVSAYMVTSIIFLNVETKVDTEEKVTLSKEIYSLDLFNSEKGNFYLGTGEIKTDMKYYFYIQNEDGSYKLCEEKAEDTSIFQIKENEVPKIEYRSIKGIKSYKKTMPKIFEKLGISKLYGANGEWEKSSPSSFGNTEKIEAKIYIPEGSIKSNYNPNL